MSPPLAVTEHADPLRDDTGLPGENRQRDLGIADKCGPGEERGKILALRRHTSLVRIHAPLVVPKRGDAFGSKNFGEQPQKIGTESRGLVTITIGRTAALNQQKCRNGVTRTGRLREGQRPGDEAPAAPCELDLLFGHRSRHAPLPKIAALPSWPSRMVIREIWQIRPAWSRRGVPTDGKEGEEVMVPFRIRLEVPLEPA